jgi:hypothetical protein
MRSRVTLTILAALFALRSHPAFAAEGDEDASLDAAVQASSDDASSDTVPLACDGALCDTTNGAECSVHGGAVGGAPFDGECVAMLTLIAALCVARRAPRGATRPGYGAPAC